MGSPEHKKKIWEMISDIGVGMLVTQSGEDLTSRPMQLVQDDYDGTLWMYTSLSSSMVNDIKLNRSVAVVFSCPEKSIHVTLSGKAGVRTEPELIDKYWNSFVSAWYPEGRDDKEIALLQIDVSSGEHWKNETSKVGYLYKVAKANLTGTTPDMGENKKF